MKTLQIIRLIVAATMLCSASTAMANAPIKPQSNQTDLDYSDQISIIGCDSYLATESPHRLSSAMTTNPSHVCPATSADRARGGTTIQTQSTEMVSVISEQGILPINFRAKREGQRHRQGHFAQAWDNGREAFNDAVSKLIVRLATAFDLKTGSITPSWTQSLEGGYSFAPVTVTDRQDPFLNEAPEFSEIRKVNN